MVIDESGKHDDMMLQTVLNNKGIQECIPPSQGGLQL